MDPGLYVRDFFTVTNNYMESIRDRFANSHSFFKYLVFMSAFAEWGRAKLSWEVERAHCRLQIHFPKKTLLVFYNVKQPRNKQ